MQETYMKASTAMVWAEDIGLDTSWDTDKDELVNIARRLRNRGHLAHTVNSNYQTGHKYKTIKEAADVLPGAHGGGILRSVAIRVAWGRNDVVFQAFLRRNFRIGGGKVKANIGRLAKAQGKKHITKRKATNMARETIDEIYEALDNSEVDGAL
jgi:hypothetical protein